MEMERFYGKTKEEDQGSVALVLDLATAFERVGPPCGLGLGDALQLLKGDVAGAVWLLRAPEASAVRRMCGGPATDHHDHLARVTVELPAPTCCVAGCAV